jgi:hypothetical protein
MPALTRQAILGDEFADLFAEQAAPGPAAPVDREALGARLIENLGSQLELYRAYREQAERQRQALVNRRLAENVDANGAIEKLLHSLAGLEEERLKLTNAILGPRKAGDASTPAKCEALYPLIGSAHAARLKECRDALVEAVADLKGILAVNQALIENGSRIIHTYGRVQVRNLVNRSV